jgi:hypothetical protein
MKRINGTMAIVLSSVAVLVVVLVGWFAFVSPQRSKASDLSDQVASASTELANDEALIAAPHRKQTEADAKIAQTAVPDQAKVSELLRQLTAYATQSRTELDSISPGTPTVAGTAQALPIQLTFKGRYFGLQKLLKLLRQSADLKNGKVTGKGRLYTVDSIQFAGGASGGDITATLAINAFIYTGATAPVPAPVTTTESSTAAGP